MKTLYISIISILTLTVFVSANVVFAQNESTEKLQNLINHFPNISKRVMTLNLQEGKDMPYLDVTVSDKITLEKPSESVIFQQLFPMWENKKSIDLSLGITDEQGNNIGASYFQPDTLGELIIGPSTNSQNVIFIENPFNMPLQNTNDAVIINYAMAELGPENGTYHLRFSSFYPVKINLPDNVFMISNNTHVYSQFWNMSENGIVQKSNVTSISFDASKINVNNVIVYDLTFSLDEELKRVISGITFGQNLNNYLQETFPSRPITVKTGYAGSEIVLNQTITKTVYKSDEPIPINRTVANIGNSSGYTSYPWPFFGYITMNQKGEIVWNATKYGAIDTIDNAIVMPAKSHAVAHYQMGDPDVLQISNPGNYTLITYSVLDVYDNDPPLGQKPNVIKSVILLSKPVLVTILPEKYDQSKTITIPTFAANYTFSAESDLNQIPSLEILIDHQSVHNSLYLIMETKIPGFGGVYIDNSRTLNICLTRPMSINASDLSTYFPKDQLANGVKVNLCKYSYIQLMQLNDIMSQLSNDPSLGVTIMTGWDEQDQVYKIGLQKVDDAKIAKIDQFLVFHNIPVDLVQINEVNLEPIPEFPLVSVVLLASIISVIIPYGMRFRK
jgi:hypothetical protein